MVHSLRLIVYYQDGSEEDEGDSSEMEEEEDTEEGEEDSEDEEEEEMCLPGMDGKEEVCTWRCCTSMMQLTNQQCNATFHR